MTSTVSKVLFFGRSNCEYSSQLLNLLVSFDYEVTFIESDIRTSNLPDRALKWNGDYIFSFRNLFFLPISLIKSASKAAINFHPGPPEYPGSGSVNFALFNEDKKFGITAHLMNELIDQGKIIKIKRFAITKNETLQSLTRKTHLHLFEMALELITKLHNEPSFLTRILSIDSKYTWKGSAKKIKELNNLQVVNFKTSKDVLERIIKSSHSNEYPVNIKLHGYNFTYHDGLEKLSKKNHIVKKRVVIIGAGGHAKVVSEIIKLNSQRYECIGVIDNHLQTGSEFMTYRVLGNEEEIKKIVLKYMIDGGIVAIGDNALRNKIATSIENMIPEFNFINCIHPNALISSDVLIGSGNVFMAGSIVNSSTCIGDHNIFNTNCSVDHDNLLQDFISIGPNAKTGGDVSIEKYSAIGIGATLEHKVSIGQNCIIGSNSLVNKDTKPNSVYYGMPAKFIRKHKFGSKYL